MYQYGAVATTFLSFPGGWECICLQVGLLRKQAERARAETLLSLGGELSSSNCYLELQAGAGGTESHDWTSMLYKMYTRWAETKAFACEFLVDVLL